MRDLDWSWSWGPPGNGTARADFGDNLFFDIVRLIIIIGGVYLAFMIARVIREQRRRSVHMPRTQVARFVGLLLMNLSISITEAWVMGTPATPRLIVNFLAIMISGWGVHGARQKQRLSVSDIIV